MIQGTYLLWIAFKILLLDILVNYINKKYPLDEVPHRQVHLHRSVTHK
jgi:hypothetical protein